jgi:hypothetical protein
MRCAILIPTTDNEPFRSIENEGQRQTWVKSFSNNKDIKIFYYKFDSLTSSIKLHDKDNILFPGEESKADIGKKTVQAFQFIKDRYDPDFIYRTNISSYIHYHTFINHIEEIPKNKFYGGLIGYHPPRGSIGQMFCSGSGYFISRDLINLCLSKKQLWNHSLPDDVAISQIFLQEGIRPLPQERFDFPHLDSSINIDVPDDIFHFRCKFPQNRSIDIQRMHFLHKYLGY